MLFRSVRNDLFEFAEPARSGRAADPKQQRALFSVRDAPGIEISLDILVERHVLKVRPADPAIEAGETVPRAPGSAADRLVQLLIAQPADAGAAGVTAIVVQRPQQLQYLDRAAVAFVDEQGGATADHRSLAQGKHMALPRRPA